MANQLYSGGQEGVIVKWNAKTCEKVAMVPRLGATVCNIHNSAAHLVISTTNNVLKIFTSNLNEVAIIDGLSADASKSMFWHYSAQTLAVMSTKKRQIQFFDPLTKSEKLTFDVSAVNQVLGERQDVVVNEDISFTLSSCGEWLATVETNWDTLNGNCLKIWRYEAAKLILNTRINQPHSEPARVLSFMTLPSGEKALLSCGKHRAKLWKFSASSGTWDPVRSFSYLNKRPVCTSQSPDGSVIAIAFESSLTLWNADTFSMITCLSVKGDVVKTYQSLAFGTNESNHLIFGATEDSVVVWNVLTNRLSRRLPVQDPTFFSIGANIGILHSDGITEIDSSFKLTKLTSDTTITKAVTNPNSSRIYVLSGTVDECHLGYLNLKQFTEHKNELVSSVTEPSILDNAMKTRLDPSTEKNIYYARVNSNFMTPEVISRQISSISSLLVKKSLPV